MVGWICLPALVCCPWLGWFVCDLIQTKNWNFETFQVCIEKKIGEGEVWSTDRRAYPFLGFPGGSTVKNLPAVLETQETRVRTLGREDPLKGGMSALSSILAWTPPWTEGYSPWGHKESDRTEHTHTPHQTAVNLEMPLGSLSTIPVTGRQRARAFPIHIEILVKDGAELSCQASRKVEAPLEPRHRNYTILHVQEVPLPPPADLDWFLNLPWSSVNSC